MPAPKLSPTRITPGQPSIDIATAAGVWALAWLVGNIVGSAVVQASGYADAGVDKPVWVTVVSAASLWTPLVVGLFVVSRRSGSGSVAADFGLSFRPVDLVGVPLGVLSQLVLLPLLYWPLQQWWPGTFGREHVEKSARDLYDTASGGWLVALVLVVVVGAPIVEELVYRGLIQGSLARRVNEPLALVLAAAWFAIIHFRPVEYPGLFAIGLVLGLCALRTGRLGMGIVTHLAFNATGLVLVAGR